MVSWSWLFLNLWFKRLTEELVFLHYYGNEVRNMNCACILFLFSSLAGCEALLLGSTPRFHLLHVLYHGPHCSKYQNTQGQVIKCVVVVQYGEIWQCRSLSILALQLMILQLLHLDPLGHFLSVPSKGTHLFSLPSISNAMTKSITTLIMTIKHSLMKNLKAEISSDESSNCQFRGPWFESDHYPRLYKDD